MTILTTDREGFPETATQHFKKNLLATAITLTIGTATFTASADLSTGAALQFVLGTEQVVACSYGTTPPCAIPPYNVTDIVGSYFAMDFIAPIGIITPNEKFPIGSFNGIVIGTTQPAGGSHSGPVDGTESPNIDQPWTFFGGTGMHQTTAAVTVNGGAGDNQTLDMSGWNVTWNGIPSIPLVEQGPAVISCDQASCSDSSNYTLDSAFHIAGAGFTTVSYFLHLEGHVGPPPMGNLPPVADPNGPYSGNVGAPVTFDGSGSSDPDGTVADYRWEFGDGSTGVGEMPAYTYGTVGTYNVMLVVTDDEGAPGSASTTATIGPPLNLPPDCSAAATDPSEIWPPNHKLVSVAITGVTDADGDSVAVTVDGVSQDEAVSSNGNGAGNTTPDATLEPLAVRAERNGNTKTPGDGRVYHIDFTADDGNGGVCTGSTTVCVPHDQGGNSTCVDGGPLHDSTDT